MIAPKDNKTMAKLMQKRGVNRYRARVENNRRKGLEYRNPYGSVLMKKILPEYIAGVEAWLNKATTGPEAPAQFAVRELGVDICCFITAQKIINSISLMASFSATVIDISDGLDMESKCQWLAREHKEMWKEILHKTKRSQGSYRRFADRINNFIRLREMNPPRIERNKRIKAASVLLQLFVDSTKLAETLTQQNPKNPRKFIKYLAPKPALIDWITDFNKRDELLSPEYLPLPEPPPRWESPDGCIEDLLELPLVKTRHKAHLEALRTAKMPQVYEAVNALQNTAWTINRAVLEVMQDCMKRGIEIGDLVSMTQDVPMPERPEDFDTNEGAKKAWKKKAVKTKQANLTLNSRRIMTARIVKAAALCEHLPRFHFVYQLDFRGRVYCVADYFNPQAGDLARSMLKFEEGKMLSYEGRRAMQIYGATLFGVKGTHEDKLKWYEDNELFARQAAQEPLARRAWWGSADDPWQFLAWCMELEKYQSNMLWNMPLFIDGSNNGLQILSLLSRDEVGGALTNVVPSTEPQDIYQAVADTTTECFFIDASEGDERTAATAAFWMTFGIDRKTCKRPVMVLPYGGTRFSCVQYLKEWTRELLRERREDYPDLVDDDFAVNRLCAYLGERVWESIGGLVEKPQQVMKFLRDIANTVIEEGKDLTWTAPSGFPVCQVYPKQKREEVVTFLHGKSLKVRINSDQREADKSRHRNGLPPNFVHSLDASAMVRTIWLAKKFGLKSFAAVHDSFATLPNDMPVLAACVRESFAQIFAGDILREFKESQGSDIEPPEYGKLVVSDVIDSVYFFD